jgi:multidrug efflux pump
VAVNIDREKAASLGISAQTIGRALETMFGSRRVTTYIKNGQEYDVLLQADRAQRETEQDLTSCMSAPAPARRSRWRRW